MHSLPNFLTLLRIFLIVPFIYYFLDRQFDVAITLFAIAAVSDALDGYLARRYHCTSRFGSIADPVADKILLVSCILLLYYFDQLPAWLVLTVIGRDCVIFCGALAFHFLIGAYDMQPSQISKINTFLQLVLILMLLINLAYPIIPSMAVTAMIWLVMLAAMSSGVDYVWTWSLRAFNLKQQISADKHEL